MAKKASKKEMEMSKEEKENVFLAFLTSFLSIIGFILAFLFWRDKKYVMFYAKQCLVVFLFGIIAGALGKVLFFFPIMGPLIDFALNFLVFLAWLLSWVYALSGEMKEIPLLGEWARKIRF
jgi:uncharacterized membrane protein